MSSSNASVTPCVRKPSRISVHPKALPASKMFYGKSFKMFLIQKIGPEKFTTVTDLHFSLFSSHLYLSSHLFSLLISISSRLSLPLFSFTSHLCFSSLMRMTAITGSISSLCALSARVHGPWPFRCLARSSLDTTVHVYLGRTRAT